MKTIKNVKDKDITFDIIVIWCEYMQVFEFHCLLNFPRSYLNELIPP